MRTIIVTERTTLPNPQWVDPVEAKRTGQRVLTAAQVLEFKPGTWQVPDAIADLWERRDVAPPVPHVDVEETAPDGPSRGEIKAKKG